MDLLRRRRLRRITQAVYDGAAAGRGDDVERQGTRWLPGPVSVLTLVVVLLLIAGGSLWRAGVSPVQAPLTPGTAVPDAGGSLQSGGLQSGGPDEGDAAFPDGGAGEARTQAPGGGAGGDPTQGGDVADPSGETAVIVYVTGEVEVPGVVELPGGSRVVDALERAGGTTQVADLDVLNLARVVVDGEHIVVWAQGEGPPGAAGSGSPGAGGSSTGTAPGAAGDGASACVDLATADSQALQALDGVGPALAGRILAYREQVGVLTSVEQLDEVPGIGPALVQRISVGVCA